MGFSADVTRFVQKTGLKMNTVHRKIGLDGFLGVLKRSPVDTGRFRGSWRLAIKAPDLGVLSARSEKSGLALGDPPTAEEWSPAVITVERATAEDEIWITNNLPYAKKLEDGGSKVQAPGGILAPTFQELRELVEALVRSVQ